MIRWGSLLVVVVALTACTGETRARPAAPQEETTSSEPRSTTPEQPAGTAERLEIRAGGVRLVATVRDTAAARDLLRQLPARLTAREHGGVEKTGRLPSPLTVGDEPAGADPDVGDLGYYAPGQDLVLYHGDQSYFDGIVVLGRLEGDLTALAHLDGDVDVQITRLTTDD